MMNVNQKDIENPFLFINLINKLERYFNARSDADVARGLKITPQALNNFKKKGKFPADLIINFCQKHQLSVDNFLFDKPMGVSESGASCEGMPRLMKEMIERVAYIYQHGNEHQKSLLYGHIGTIYNELLDAQERGTGGQGDEGADRKLERFPGKEDPGAPGKIDKPA